MIILSVMQWEEFKSSPGTGKWEYGGLIRCHVTIKVTLPDEQGREDIAKNLWVKIRTRRHHSHLLSQAKQT